MGSLHSPSGLPGVPGCHVNTTLACAPLLFLDLTMFMVVAKYSHQKKKKKEERKKEKKKTHLCDVCWA